MIGSFPLRGVGANADSLRKPRAFNVVRQEREEVRCPGARLSRRS
jgi:hypothetical protein